MNRSHDDPDGLAVAFLGAGGAMGLGMASNIARAGLPLRAWNRSSEKAGPLTELGAEICSTPAQTALGAEVLITMLSDADAVLEAMDGEDGFLQDAEGSLVWVQMSTVGVEGLERCAELAERHGVTLVDAPVLGTKQPAQRGELVILASGPRGCVAVWSRSSPPLARRHSGWGRPGREAA